MIGGRSWRRRHGGLKRGRGRRTRLGRKRGRRDMSGRQDRLGVRVGRDDQGRVGRLIRAWRRRTRRRRRRRVHLRIRIPGRRVLLGSVGRGKMAVDGRRVISHVRGRRSHAGGRSRIVHLMLPSRRRHGRLPMGHCGQMMVHHVQARRAGCLASMGAMRNNYQEVSNSLEYPARA